MFVLKRIPEGDYVSRPGCEHSYTRKLQDAQTFKSREHAQGNCCPANERVVRVEDEMRGRGSR